MAQYEFLPVYRTSYNLLLDLFRFTKDFSREYKFTIGESIKNEVVQMITNIYKANSSVVKLTYIQTARENIEVIKVFLRLLKDLKEVNTEKFVKLSDSCESVSKQLTAWFKYCEKL